MTDAGGLWFGAKAAVRVVDAAKQAPGANDCAFHAVNAVARAVGDPGLWRRGRLDTRVVDKHAAEHGTETQSTAKRTHAQVAANKDGVSTNQSRH